MLSVASEGRTSISGLKLQARTFSLDAKRNIQLSTGAEFAMCSSWHSILVELFKQRLADHLSGML